MKKSKNLKIIKLKKLDALNNATQHKHVLLIQWKNGAIDRFKCASHKAADIIIGKRNFNNMNSYSIFGIVVDLSELKGRVFKPLF